MVAASGLEAEILAEKRHNMILKTIGHRTGMGSLIDLEAVLQTVFIEYGVELGGVDIKAVLVANVHGDALISPQIADILIDKRQGSVCGPLCENIWLRLPIFDRK